LIKMEAALSRTKTASKELIVGVLAMSISAGLPLKSYVPDVSAPVLSSQEGRK